MISLLHAILFIVSASCVQLGRAQEWNQWRGPDRNGFCKETIKLVDALDAKPLPQVWKSEKILSDKDGGFGSPVVANGKVYLYCSWRTYHNLDFLKISKDDVRRIGLIPDQVDDALMAKLDGARPAMLEIPDMEARKKAANEWVAANLSADEKKLLGPFAQERLIRGKEALSVAVLRKVMSIVDRTFANQAELDAWYVENGIADADRKQVTAIFPTQASTFEDMMFCLNANDGKTVWKKTWPNDGISAWGASSTPLVLNQRIFMFGCNGSARCLDAATGEEKWTTPIPIPTKGDFRNSSFAFFDGKVFILVDHLFALNADTGAIVWEQKEASGGNSSPMFWTNEGQTYLICGGDQIACVTPNDGKVLWKVKGGGHTTPVIVGNSMVVSKGYVGPQFYRITPSAATLVIETKIGGSRGASVATDGKFFYSSGKNEATAYDVNPFDLAWQSPGLKEEFSSPVVADGKVLGFSDHGELGLFNAATGAFLGKTGVDALRCTSPVLSGGHLLVRTKEAVVCYDLQKKAE